MHHSLIFYVSSFEGTFTLILLYLLKLIASFLIMVINLRKFLLHLSLIEIKASAQLLQGRIIIAKLCI